jgi:hypothetical protein
MLCETASSLARHLSEKMLQSLSFQLADEEEKLPSLHATL